MAVIEKFLGQKVQIPENLRYDAKRGLWAQAEDQDIIFGLTAPVLVYTEGSRTWTGSSRKVRPFKRTKP